MPFVPENFDPNPYTRLGPAWRAALALLAPGQWCTREDLYAAMFESSDLKPRSVMTLLQDGRKAGLFELDPPPGPDGYTPGRGKGPRRFRLREDMLGHPALEPVLRFRQELEKSTAEAVK